MKCLKHIIWCHDLSPGTMSADWSVTFENPDPCAVKGSSVEFRCSYNYSERETVKNTTWSKGELINGLWKRVNLLDLPSLHNRSKYLGDLLHDCSLAIYDVQHNDTGYYYFKFDTNTLGRHSKKSVYLTVTGKTILHWVSLVCLLLSPFQYLIL